MALTLTIENFSALPDGGPLSHKVSGGRGFDFGRDTYLDWTLPDPNMFISGKHCEVRCQDGGYWLYDVSLNGTYLNGADHRLLEPYRLRHGDRLCVGQYIIAVTIDEEAFAPQQSTPAPSSPVTEANLWDFEGDVPAPIDPRELRPVKPRAVAADFLDWAIDAPAPARTSGSGEAASPWPAVPRPERPVWDLDAPVPGFDAPAPIRPDLFGAATDPKAQDPEAQDIGAEGAGAEDLPAWSLPAATPIDFPAPPPPPAVPRPDRPGDALRPDGLEPGHRRPPRPAAAAAEAPIPLATEASREFVTRFAAAAGISPDAIATRDAGEFAEQLGSLMAIVVAEMWQLLEARRETKRMVRCSDPTMTTAENNNPLKFAPTPRDALRQMLGPPSRAYLSAGPALVQGFADLARHQIDTIAAMQGAIRLLIEDLDPREIERTYGTDRGLSAMLGARKAKLWDIYVERWRARTRTHDDGLYGAFMDYFSKCYDRNVADRT